MHDQKIRKQFAARVESFARSASWMDDNTLISAHIALAGTPQPDRKCLDLCCGPGIVGKAFLKEGWQVTGIDATPEMSEAASAFFPSVHGGIERMPFDDDEFDLAVLRQSFMLVRGPEALQEIRRVLKPDGRFIISQSFAFSPEDEPQYRKVQEARHINMIRYYTVDDLVSELEAHGYTVEKEKHLTVRESVDHWLRSAPELTNEQRREIRALIADAPEKYRTAHRVDEIDGELFEDWNWLVISARANK